MDILVLLLVSLILAAASYAGYLLWRFAFWLIQRGYFNRQNTGRLVGVFVLSLASIAVFMPVSVGAVYAQSSIDFDLSPFFDSLNLYLPIFIGIFAIIGGIAGAIALARYVISAIVRAFAGGRI